MCIRDSHEGDQSLDAARVEPCVRIHEEQELGVGKRGTRIACLLYTSDAADERSSVDLGGRRIIKKKKTAYIAESDAAPVKK